MHVGHYLFKVGDPDDSIFVVQTGEITVSIREPVGDAEYSEFQYLTCLFANTRLHLNPVSGREGTHSEGGENRRQYSQLAEYHGHLDSECRCLSSADKQTTSQNASGLIRMLHGQPAVASEPFRSIWC